MTACSQVSSPKEDEEPIKWIEPFEPITITRPYGVIVVALGIWTAIGFGVWYALKK